MVDGKRVQAFKKSLGPDKPAGHRRKARAERKAKMAKRARSHTAAVREASQPVDTSSEAMRQARNRRKAAKR